MPWATPPWTWPSTIIGLISSPKSSTAVQRSIVDDPGLRIDLKLADMDAGGEGEVGRIPEGGLLQARLQFLAVELVGV